MSTKIKFLLLFLFLSVPVLAQNTAVSGIVTDNTGLPVIGATVYEQGNTSNGVITDVDGKWSLKTKDGARIVFSCLGYKETVVSRNGSLVLDVVLEDDRVAIEEAVVVSDGYNTVAKRDLTGSVSSVDMANLVKVPVTSFDQALGGRVAGVVVTTSDGSLGAEANITIRGNNSLTQSSAPLFIIDGFPTESSMASSISPADIESVDILKDASATAIYGARGANGVVVINTKQGVDGKPKVNFLGTWSVNKIANKVDLMGAYDFVAMQTEMYGITGGTNFYLADGHTLEEYRNATSIDWQDRIYRVAPVQNYNISLSGGSKTSGTNYNISLGVTDQDGIIINSNFQRYQGKVNFSQEITKNLKFNLLANYSRAVTQGTNPTAAQQSSSATGWLMYSVWGYRPTRPLSQTAAGDDFLDALIDSEASNSNDYRFNPAKTVQNEVRKTSTDYISGNASLVWSITDELKLKASVGYNTNKRRTEAFNGSQTYTGYEGSPSGKGINGYIYFYDKASWLNEYVLTYSKTVKRQHHVQLQGIFSMQGENSDFYGSSANQFSTESLGLLGIYTGEYQTVKPYEYDWRIMSGAARLNYNYKYKYYLTASFRADGSSKFPTANRWGFFPSGSLAWNFNREDALKGLDWLSNGKLRLSWGLTGNNRTTTPYDFYSQITTSPGQNGSYDYVYGGKSVAGYYPSNMANDRLKWETTEQTDLGLDLAFFENRIKFTGDVYLKNTRDLLLQATNPASSGYTSLMMNIGSMQNRGMEFTLDLVPVRTRDFEWNFSFNIAINRNKVTALTDNQYSLLQSVYWDQKFNSQNAYITQVGKPSGMMYGYIYDGTYKASDFNSAGQLLDGIPYMGSVGKSSVKPGDPKYRDITEDGVVDDNDRTIIGCGQPLHTGGINNNIFFKGFDLNFFFQWSYGNDVLNANKLVFEDGTRLNLNQFSSYMNRFNAVTNPASDIPGVQANGMAVYSSRVVEDGSFLRLKNITLGYTLPSRVLRRLRLSAFRVYLSAENIWTVTNYSGPDPEVSTRNSVLTPGFDWSAYPRAFALTAGINFTL